jgi:CHAT domain-containing protein
MNQTGDRRGQAHLLFVASASRLAIHDDAAALEALKQGLDLIGDGDHWVRANLLSFSARARLQRREYGAAVSLADQAAEAFRSEDLRGYATALVYLAESLRFQKNEARSLELLHEALPIFQRLRYPTGESTALAELARVEANLGRPEDAERHIEAALKIIDSVRNNVFRLDLRTSYFGARRAAYEFAIELAMRRYRDGQQASHDIQALQFSERARARVLLDLLWSARTNPRREASPELVRRERDLGRAIAAKQEALKELIRRKAKQEEDATVKQLDSIIEQHRQLVAEIDRRDPRSAALSARRPIEIAEIQSLLDPDTALVEFWLGSENSGSYAWVVERNRIRSFALNATGPEIAMLARRWHELLTARSSARNPQSAEYAENVKKADNEASILARQLGQILLEPVYRVWNGKRLILVPDGALFYIPFSALPVQIAGKSGMSLIDLAEVITLPSASTLTVLRQANAARRPALRTLAVLADPASRSAGPRVPEARQEAYAITRGLPNSQYLLALDSDASVALALSDRLRDFRIVHFATHAVADSARPELSGLFLSSADATGERAQGFLGLADIYSIRLNADLVVLSGCSTALGQEIRGEGIVGLTRGFLYAGAGKVLASLWDVRDNVTARLMERLYEGMLTRGLSPAAALREAQKWVRQQPSWNAPYFWAGFTLQGDYQWNRR